MTLDEIFIKSLIKEYQSKNTDDTVYKFQECTYHYVRNWPKMRYRCDEDVCQDFVVYVLEYTSQILQSYPLDSDVKFSTWFSATLYYKFCDFTKTGEVNVKTVDYDIAEEIAEESRFESSVLDELSPIDRSLCLFYYNPHELDNDSLIELVDYTKKSIQEILLLYQESLKVQYSCSLIKDTYIKKLKTVDFRLSHYHNIVKKDTAENVEIIKQKILRLENRRYKMEMSLKIIDKKSFKVFVKLFKDYNQAYRVLKKIKLKLRKISS